MSAYVEGTLSVDAITLQDRFIARLQTVIPGWVPVAGQLETIMMEAIADMAETYGLDALQMPEEAFRYFAQWFLGLARNQGDYATAATTWVLTDTLGHTIPAGTFLTIEGAEFQTLSDVTVAPGLNSTPTGGVQVIALDVGAASNGLQLSPTLVSSLDWVSSITVEALSAGGADVQSDEDYRNDVSLKYQLLSDRLILPDDYTTEAKQNDSVARAVAIDNYLPAGVTISGGPINTAPVVLSFDGQLAQAPVTVSISSSLTGGSSPGVTVTTTQAGLAPTEASEGVNQITTLTETGSPTGGTFTIAVNGQPSSAIAYNASASTIQTTLQALSGVGAANAAAERAVTVAVLSPAGTVVSTATKQAVLSEFNRKREVNFLPNVIDPTFTTVNITYSVKVYPTFDTASTLAEVDSALAAFLAPLTWGIPQFSDSDEWLNETVVRLNKVVQTIENVQGVRYTTNVLINGSATDLTLSGVAPLPILGTTTGTAI